MKVNEMIRAWKEPAYRNSLSEAERLQMPENPVGLIELSGTALDAVAGGGGKSYSKKKSSKSHKSSKSGKSSGSHKSSKSGKSGKSGKSCHY